MHFKPLIGLQATLIGALGVTISAAPAMAQQETGHLRGIFESREVKVDIDNFVRAATNMEIGKYLAFSGGVNKLFHLREPTRVDQQPTVRMNRDTLYSMAIIDISEGASVTLPETGDRYISAHIVNQDHYMDVFSGGGTYPLSQETFATPYVVMIIRTLVDAADPDDISTVHELQDQIKIDAGSSRPFIMPNYDEDSFDAVLAAAKALADHIPDSSRTFGMPDEVDPIRHFLGAAFGWGGLPETEAFYLNVVPNLPVGEYQIDIPADVPVGAFWSVSLYNAQGFFEPNSRNAYNVNSVTGARNDDGSMVVHLGGCEDNRVNCLPIMEGWNYTVRLYQPGPEILDGNWRFPEAVSAN
ncbi:DUF1214 domain-containing protein [Shimia biformata]|uniref:DUF1214 domain-containing protein n=1 Tax=Shimia biformata TaxID=1294299 RepID=UPI00194EAF5C|nr:DUF1254 domain-containing protein [Shimia biformata]